MNREQVLASLREIRAQLPIDLLDSSYSETISDEIADELFQEELELRKATSAGIADEAGSAEIVRLEREVQSLNDELTVAENEVSSIRSDIANSEIDAKKFGFLADRDTRRLEFMVDEEQRNALQASIESNRKDEQLAGDWVNTARADLQIAEAYRDECRIRLEEETVRLDAARRKETEEINEKHRLRVAELRGRVNYLKTRAANVANNVAETLDGMIEDYEAGSVDEAYINGRMLQLRDVLGSNELVNSFEQRQATDTYERIDAQVRDYDTRIAELESKLGNPNSYIKPETEYVAERGELVSERSRERRNLSAQNRRYQSNLTEMASIYDEVQRLGTTNPEETQRLQARLEKLRVRNEGIQSRMDARMEYIESLNKQIGDVEKTHGIKNDELENEDRKLLAQLKTDRERVIYEDRLHRISLDDKIVALLVGTGSKVEDLAKKKEEPVVATPVVEAPEIKPEDRGITPPTVVPPMIKPEDRVVSKPEASPALNDEEFPEMDDEEFPKIDEEEEFPEIPEEPGAEEPLDEIIGVEKAPEKPKSFWKRLLKKAALWLTAIGLAGALGIGINRAIEKNSTSNPISAITASVDDSTPSAEDEISYEASKESMDELHKLLDLCNEVDGDLYTDETYDPMMEKVNHIENLLEDDGKMTEDTCETEKDELQELYDNLQLRKKDGKGPGGPGEPGGSGETGDTTPVAPPDEPVTPPDEPITPPDEPVTPPDEPVTPPDEPVTPPDDDVDPDEEHDQEDGMPIYLDEGDAAGELGPDGNPISAVGRDGSQYDADGNKIGETELDETPGGYGIVEEDDLPDIEESAPDVPDVPTGHETTDTSDLTTGEKENLDAASQETLDAVNSGEADANEVINWEGFDFSQAESTPVQSESAPVEAAPAPEAEAPVEGSTRIM